MAERDRLANTPAARRRADAAMAQARIAADARLGYVTPQWVFDEAAKAPLNPEDWIRVPTPKKTLWQRVFRR